MLQSKWSPVIAWYHGLQKDSLNQNYPFGSLDILDPSGTNEIPGAELSLRLDGENGLYEKKWKRFLEWRIKAKTIKVKILPDRKFLQTLDFRTKKVINGVHYLLVEYRGSISKNGMGIAELTLIAL
jgi:hypothetical protein